MLQNIKFSHIVHLLDKMDCISCTVEQFNTAITSLCNRDLRFNNASGIVRDNQLGELEKYSNPSDFVPYSTPQEVMDWVFKRYVNNSISRLQRGFSA